MFRARGPLNSDLAITRRHRRGSRTGSLTWVDYLTGPGHLKR